MCRLALGLLVTGLVLAGTASSAQDATAEDEQLLRGAGFATDEPGLVGFFRKRTLTPADQDHIEALVQQLGDRSFRTRSRAANDLVGLGCSALPALHTALRAADPEVARQARACVETIERGPGATLPAAAARLLRVRKPPGACAALLGYLPFAADAAVEDEVIAALVVLGAPDGKVDAALPAALTDPAPARRAAAALVVGRSGTEAQRAEVRRLLGDRDARVRLRAALGLLAGHDRRAVPTLIALLADAPPDVAEVAEDSLTRLAAGQGPPVPLGDDAALRRKCRAAWAGWWKAHEAGLDLARADTDLPLVNATQQAREMARQFLKAFVRGDAAGFARTTDLPFFVAGFQTLQTRKDLEEFQRMVSGFSKQQKIVLTPREVVGVDEYARMAGTDEQAALAKMRKQELRVVYVDSEVDGRSQGGGAVFVRVSGGRARVVGIGNGRSPRAAKK